MRQALGKGLDALIPKAQDAIAVPSVAGPIKIPIEKIRPNHMQPRKFFDPEKLAELSASIREHGLAQPIVVSYDESSKTYELIAGERRLRAAELAGLKEIEVVVRTPDSDKKRLALALIENIQREDLNPIETALAYLRLMKEAQITQTQLTQVLGKSKSTISNTLRLLDLPENIQKALQFSQLTEGHARALLMIENPIEKQRVFSLALENKLSVREVEDLARAANGVVEQEDQKESPTKINRVEKSSDIRALESSLQQILGTKVNIRTRKDPSVGTITLHFYTLSDFDRILNVIKK